MRLRKNWSKNFLKKTIDILQHVWYNTSCQQDNDTVWKNRSAVGWKKYLTHDTMCGTMSTTKQGTHTDRQSGIWANGTEFGRATCQVIPLCPPTCVCTLHGFKSSVCMHGGRAKVYPPTRTQGKAENTKNFFLTHDTMCDRIKLHRTAKAARWTAKAKKIILDTWHHVWYNKDKLKSWTTR